MAQDILILFSSISFVIYSLNSIFSKRMILEFSRWGVGNLRILVASFQMFGGIGLFLGMYNVWLLCLASFLLTLMMISAVIIRIRVKDSVLITLPAIIYALVNSAIFYFSFLAINT
ncbi:MAG: hypothetical protein CMG14_03175 [Candidatus Marinimicrobia bacterium]|nr:hypothetical protein [Candidatus Neomarinimicrobiota bacterium]